MLYGECSRSAWGSLEWWVTVLFGASERDLRWVLCIPLMMRSGHQKMRDIEKNEESMSPVDCGRIVAGDVRNKKKKM